MGVEGGGVERGDTPSLPEVLKPEVSSAPHNKKRVWGTATNILLEIFINKVKIVSLRSVLRVGAMPLKRFF